MAAAVEALIDTGPLVGFLDRSDQWHEFSVRIFPQIRFPAFTCEAVISEAVYLLSGADKARDALLEMVEMGALVVLPVFPDGYAYVRTVLRNYGAKTDLADAVLLWLAETQPALSLVTTDRKDFARYRLRGKSRELRLITP